ncbi:MAG TPA: DUF1846 domain-containing protein [Erysipelotrichaceae bacterium]|nr:DUF1846 domain-containing protein [Erysipelotrichaceae bacterium]
MKKIGFDNEKYFKLQKEKIQERIELFDNKLYMEFGGKLFDDFHAARVLPGFHYDNKAELLMQMRDDLEVVIAINALDIEHNKIRSDNALSYDQELLRLIDSFRDMGLYVSSVVITRFDGQESSMKFKRKLENLGMKVYLHYRIDGYPSNVPFILSEKGFGRNDYIETTRPLVMITAPGSGSGKMAVCLSQLYQDSTKGLKSGYAKFETFPVWNLPLKHPVNLAYESATADLNDVNIIDPFHFSEYNIVATSYNRDADVFPVLKSVFKSIYGDSPYNSPTDMGVNVIGSCILDDEIVSKAAKDEIIRRYLVAVVNHRKDKEKIETVKKLEMLMNTCELDVSDRKIVGIANDIAKKTGNPAVAMELADGRIVTGKTSSLLGSASACLLNALKTIANIDDDIHLISSSVIKPVQELKVNSLGNTNPLLHIDEVLIMLSVAATENKYAKLAIDHIPDLAGSEMHSSVILSSTDRNVLKLLHINLTTDPTYQNKRLFRK